MTIPAISAPPPVEMISKPAHQVAVLQEYKFLLESTPGQAPYPPVQRPAAQ